MKSIPEKLGIKEYEFRLVIGTTRIDYDPNKEALNRIKHGYSLESAVYLLERCLLPISGNPFITSDPFREGGEIRHQHIGFDDAGNVVFMVTTMRPDETVRVISFRRADNAERELFRSLTGYSEPTKQT